MRHRRPKCRSGSPPGTQKATDAFGRLRGLFSRAVRRRITAARARYSRPQAGLAGGLHQPPDNHTRKRRSLLPKRQPVNGASFLKEELQTKLQIPRLAVVVQRAEVRAV